MADDPNIPNNPRFKNLLGRKFAMLTVERYAEKRGRKHYWHCRCECGALKTIAGHHLLEGVSKSCGCYRAISQRETWTKHGHAPGNKRARHPLYETWCSMWKRCTNPNTDAYPWYGALGVVVCERWRDFAAFVADVGAKPAPEYSIDRIDPHGNYEPSNIRWATPVEQMANRRDRT